MGPGEAVDGCHVDAWPLLAVDMGQHLAVPGLDVVDRELDWAAVGPEGWTRNLTDGVVRVAGVVPRRR